MKPSEPFRAARPTPSIRHGQVIASTLAIVGVSAGLHALAEAELISQSILLVAALVAVPLTTYLTAALEWKALNPPAQKISGASEPIDMVKLFQMDIHSVDKASSERFISDNDEDA